MKKETVKNQISESEKIVKDNFKNISDDDLQKDLSDFNIENLIQKSAKGRSIWKIEFKKSFADSEKKARRLIRKTQLNLSKKLIADILTKQDFNQSAKNLQKFYNDGLIDFSVFSNVSENENPENYKTIHRAYDKMKQILNL